MELAVSGRTYVFGHLDAFVAMHVSRKLFPMVMAMQRSMSGFAPEELKLAQVDDEKAKALFDHATSPLIMAFAEMKNEDVDYILDKCLAVVQAKDPTTGALSPLRVNGRMMYEDVDMPKMLRLAFIVVKEDLGDFFLNPLGAILPKV